MNPEASSRNLQDRRGPLVESTRYITGHEVRCSCCYKNEASSVCAICGRFTCDSCAEQGGFFSIRGDAVDLPSEAGTSKGSVYCPQHRPRGVSLGRLLSAATGVGGVVGSAVWFPLGLALLLVSVGLLAVSRSIDRAIWPRSKRTKDIYGVLPRYAFDFKENLKLDFNLGATSNEYASHGPAMGELTIGISAPAYEVSRYCQKKGDRSCFKDLHIGFARFEQSSTLKCSDSSALQSEPGGAISFLGPIPKDLETSFKHRKRLGQKFSYECPLYPTDSGEERHQERSLPILVLPNDDASELNSRSWGLIFKLGKIATRKATLKSLSVKIPPELQGVKFTDGMVESEKQQVFWTNLPISDDLYARILIEFCQPVHFADQIECSYRIEVNNTTLSGFSLKRQCVWYPSGRLVPEGDVTITQFAAMEGKITAATRLQPKRQEVISRARRLFPGCELTDQLANDVIRVVSDNGVYAKDITEGPAVLASSDEGVLLSRYWEILGRYYIKYQPYDIHFILTGERSQAAKGQASEPSLSADITIRSLSQLQFVRNESQDAEALAQDLMLSVEQLVRGGKVGVQV